MKRCSTSLVFREPKIRTTARYHLTPSRMAVIRKMVKSLGKDMEELELSSIAGGSLKWCSQFGKGVWQFHEKVSIEFPLAQQELIIHPRKLKTYAHTKTCTQMFIAASLIIVPKSHVPLSIN